MSMASGPEKYQTACMMLVTPGRIALSTGEMAAYAKLNPQKMTPHATPSAAPTATSAVLQRMLARRTAAADAAEETLEDDEGTGDWGRKDMALLPLGAAHRIIRDVP
ncbi:hypothetical protein BIFGAL_03658 [Bifidobacterium gallicum DSM 20093 = LMG 11596]|uniref:Uncharacterized protein n=1 Tax=Bifidobacterium gallicum DSM 20093 = LMG 11596 TaxID=561180 RepID=D1NUY1_9BIFI|nr:hypothetical protein BIFGAL_03658 [Bifidobacterium gallicum DSM 20093 = LMG 11596]